jgi:hypothetical protein
MNTLAVLLLLVNVGSVEQTYGPYLRPGRGDLQAMVVADERALLAWSEVDRQTGRAAIHTALLDARGGLVGGMNVFPAGKASADALGPAVAPNGDGFLVTWIELDHRQQLRGVALDANGTQIGAPRAYTVDAPILEAVTMPTVAWDGSAYRVWGPLNALKITATGEVDTIGGPAATRPSAVAPDHAFAFVTTNYYGFAPGCWFSSCFQSKYLISWNARGTSGSHWAGNDTVSKLGVTPAGNQFAMAWGVPLGVSFLLTDGKYGSIWAEPNLDVAPGIACDATDCVVAYGTRSGDVQGVTFPIARPHETTLFTVAASERQERAPQVHAMRDGQFLVTYQTDQFQDAKLSGRIVTLGAVKRRSVR